jgi:hypothetical protein
MLQEELNMKRISSNDKSTVQGKQADECFKIQFPKGRWTQLGSKNYKKSYDLNSNLIQLIPALQNRFEVLSNLKVDDSIDASTEDDKIQILNNCSHVKGVNQIARGVKTGNHKVLLTGDRKEMRKNKIILMGDSHMKGHASKLLN